MPEAVEEATAPSRARLIVGLVMGAFAGVYALAAPSRAHGLAGVALSVALVTGVLVLQLAWLAPGVAGRQRVLGTVLQAACAYTGVLAFGTSVAMLGFVGASLLLAGAWPLTVAVVASAAVIEAWRDGAAADATITTVLLVLMLYGLVKLTARVDDAAAARLPLTMAAVARERLRITAELNEGLGHGLTTISEGSRRALDRPEDIGEVLDAARRSLNDARAAAADFRSMSLAPEMSAARAMLGAAGVDADVRTGHLEPLGPAGALLATVLREAVTGVVREGTARHCVIETSESKGAVRLRVVNDGVRTAARGEEGMLDAAERLRAAGGTLTTELRDDGRFTVDATLRAGDRRVPVPDPGAYRMTVALLAAVLAGFMVKALLSVPWGWQGPAITAALLATGALRLRWPGRAGDEVTGVRPGGGRWAGRLGMRMRGGRVRAWVPVAQVGLSFAPAIVFGTSWLGVPGFLVGSFLAGMPQRVAVPLVLGTMAGVGVCAGLLRQGAAVTVNLVFGTLVSALVVYGLVRLARLVRDLREAGEELARAATVQERLRAARDLHDLLGHSLAAILLKCELARRLAAVDRDRARAELAEVVGMAERARQDLRTATGGGAELSLDAEIGSACSVFTAAGVSVEADAGHGAVEPRVSALLSTVLREAVTNVLRHSAARHCTIVTERDGGVVRLTVENDGLDPGAPPTPPGSGIGNLATRLAAVDGTLSARADGHGGFRLIAAVPVEADAAR
ncbi:histidine kinase [Spirillospora albida]|uniref:histidine kinase n=1 Tax=Spirillospora albida TaxID=58123 RepID=UPI000690A25E|nr:histidine kinase [Spirillospora albida]